MIFSKKHAIIPRHAYPLHIYNGLYLVKATVAPKEKLGPTSHPPRMSVAERKRQLVREEILDAAARLLDRDTSGGFSMRDLAEEAGLSLVTPYKYFGSKHGVFHATVERLMLKIRTHYQDEAEGDSIERVLTMLRTGVAVLRTGERLFKAVGAVMNMPQAKTPKTNVFRPATFLWREALGEDFPLASDAKGIDVDMLAEELAVAFRGVISLWLAGEINNEEFALRAEHSVMTVLLAFVPAARRAPLLRRLREVQAKLHGQHKRSTVAMG